MRKWFLFISAAWCFVFVVNASRINDQMHLSIPEIIEKYNETEKLVLSEPERFKGLSVGAGILIKALSLKGGREFLPFYLEKSLETNLPNYIRQHAASAYIKVANLEEGANLLVKYCNDASIVRGKWSIIQEYINKYNSDKTLNDTSINSNKINSCLVEVLQTTDVRDVGNRINNHLLNEIPQYSNSIQRATLVRFATEGNEWVTNTFNPIKSHFENLPKSQLVDLREQFPDLSPLPEELIENNKQYKNIVMVGSVVVIFLILGIFFIRGKCKY